MVAMDTQDKCAEIRLTLCGVGETPVDASAAADGLIGQAPSEQAIRDAAASLQGMIEPAGNVHATTEYQRHVAGVLNRTRAPDGRSAGSRWTLTLPTRSRFR